MVYHLGGFLVAPSLVKDDVCTFGPLLATYFMLDRPDILRSRANSVVILPLQCTINNGYLYYHQQCNGKLSCGSVIHNIVDSQILSDDILH